MGQSQGPGGRNVFAGGFLGLDNIGVFDRSAPLPTGGHLDQADGTAWMAFYCQSMLEMALILTDYDSAMYEEIAFRFLEQFTWIAYAMDRIGANHDEMWDTADGFFYDLLHFPNGDAVRLKVRSMVGLLPLGAATVFEPDTLVNHPRITELVDAIPQAASGGDQKDRGSRRPVGWRIRRPQALDGVQQGKAAAHSGLHARRKRVSQSHGIRSLSKYHLEHPFVFHLEGTNIRCNTFPPSQTPACSAETPTGAAPSGCRSMR